MDDKQIIDLFWSRSENALNETRQKYNPYLKNYCNECTW